MSKIGDMATTILAYLFWIIPVAIALIVFVCEQMKKGG